MNLQTMFLIIIALQFNIMLFGAGAQHDTAIFGFISNPTDWSNSTFILLFGAIVVAGIFGGAYVGSFLGVKSDLATLAPLVGVFISWAIPLSSLWQLIYEEEDLFGTANALVASIIIAPFVILAVFSVINWWGNRK